MSLAAQGGRVGRFAVLTATTSDRALLLVEMQRSFEAALRQRLGLPESASRDEIRKAGLRTRALDGAGASKLEGLLSRLRAGEAAVSSGRRLSLSDRALTDISDQILDILSGMKHPSSS